MSQPARIAPFPPSNNGISLNEKLAQAQADLARLEAEKKVAASIETQKKLEDMEAARAMAAEYRKEAALAKPDLRRELLRSALVEEAAAAALAQELGIEPPTETLPSAILTSTRGILGMLAVGVLSGLLFWFFGTSADNESAVRMVNSLGLRVLSNLLPFSVGILVVLGTIWGLHPRQYAYWANDIDSEHTIENDLNNNQWQRPAYNSFLFLLYSWIWVELMQVIFA